MKPVVVFAFLTLFLIVPSLAFAESGTASVDVDGTTYDVSYDATGLTVDSMEADTSTDTLTVFVTTTDAQPSLAITLERSFFDSQTNGTDQDFVVLADGFETPFDDAKTDSSRTLTVTVPANTASVDIISLGTKGFAEAPQEQPQTPTETPTGTPTETPTETPQTPAGQPETQCGPGTVLQDGVCVLEQQETPTETPTETPQTPAEQPETQCGPGTVLKDGSCVLDETCGPGTIFKDGQCVLAEEPQQTSPKGGSFQLLVGIIAGFVVAFIIIIILWAIGRASRRKN